MKEEFMDADYWAALDLLFPKHKMYDGWSKQFKGTKDEECKDHHPSGGGMFGCQRCDMILKLNREGKITLIEDSGGS